MRGTARRRLAVLAVVAIWASGLAVGSPAAAAGPIIYVDIAASGADDGSSWADAFTDLQDALATATSGDEIWVAEGTYTPDASDRAVSFALVDEVDLIGGYATGGVAGPDPALYETILSGDLNGDDLPDFVNNGENSFHVVTAVGYWPVGVSSQTVINGFVITGGNANEAGFLDERGGGILNLGSSPSIVNTTIRHNAALLGGGVFNLQRSSPSITDSTISFNSATSFGGGIGNNDFSNPTITNTVISHNAAGNSGGGISVVNNSLVTLIDSTISHNTANRGGGMEHFLASSNITNSVISHNTATDSGGAIRNSDSSLTVTNTLIANNTASEGGAIWNELTSPSITNSTIVNNTADTGGAIYNNDFLPGFESFPSIVNSVLWGNSPDSIVDSGDSVSSVSFSDVQGGFAGEGNIDADPLFVGTGDYRLQGDSPARDAGDNTAVPADVFDVDDDGDTSEPTPDLDREDRIWGPTVAMGAYEFASPPVATPGIVNLGEGDVGTVVAQFPLSLSWQSPFEVTVDWTTLNWTATAPYDYVSASGTVTFAPGETTKTVPITVNADLLHELDENLLVAFANPTNATVGGFYGLGLVTIEDDDPQPTFTPSWIGINAEGDTGSTIWNYPVTLSAPAGVPVEIDWNTYDAAGPSVAQPGSDYVEASGSLTFQPGETVKNIPLEILGDTEDEPPLLWGEWGFVEFSNPVNTTNIGDFYGLGIFVIIDDDN